MNNKSANNKRLAKNTLVLYVRMLVLMAINLYVSRLILQVLGVEDYGIYNVVGGFVSLFSVVSQSLSTAASRFLTVEMGKDNSERLQKVFLCSLTIHFFLAVIIVILAESIGLWFVNTKMVIPLDRLFAANWVFQFSILSFCINLVTVPYNASVIAHENMSVYAYISIFEGVGKLATCYLLIKSPIDKLIYYALLILVVHIIAKAINIWFCRTHYYECRYHFYYDKSLFKEMFTFAGWNMIGASSAVLRSQGSNVLINLFFGPEVNAARAISEQVNHAVQGFVQSFMTALRPQIMKSYANGEKEYMMSLVLYGSRFSYYIFYILCLPILINTDYILYLWLKEVPEHFVSFVKLTLIFFLIESLSQTLVTIVLATGNTKKYQLTVGCVNLANIPISYALLLLGGNPECVFFVMISLSLLSLFLRLKILYELVQLDVAKYLRCVVFNVLCVSVISMIIPIIIKIMFYESFISVILVCLICFFCVGMSILFIGCNRTERALFYQKVVFFFKTFKNQ